MEREAMEGVHDAADLQPVRGHATERACLRTVRMHDIEAPEAGLEISEGAAVVGGRDLAAQVRHQHHLVASLACLRSRVIGGLAGDEHDLEAVRIQRQRAAQRYPAGAGHEPCDDLCHPEPAAGYGVACHADTPVAVCVVVMASSSRSGAPGWSPRVTCRHGSLLLNVSAIACTGGWLSPRPVPSASVAANAQ